MTGRQIIPRRWLIIAGEPDPAQWAAVARLPRGSGVLLLQPLNSKGGRRLRQIVRARGLTALVELPRIAARVHNQHELTSALLRRPRLILVSPIHPTPSHPERRPMPRMRAATLASLTSRAATALGGMNPQRYAKIAPLGFIGWAGISAFRT